MKRNFIYYHTIALIVLFFIPFKNNAQIKADAQLRNRFEIRNGYKSLSPQDAIPSAFISQRTRINFNYTTDFLKLTIAPQDVRVWGNEQLSSSTGVYGDDASLTLFEGYAELKLGTAAWLSVGRQQLVYDNQRLLAARNWNQNGIAYDAVVLKLTMNEWIIHTGSSWNSLSETTSNNLYLTNRIKSMNFIWINRELNENLKFSFLHISSGITETDSTNNINFRHTTGFYTEYRKGNFNFWGNMYYQFGKNQLGINVNAFLIEANLNYKIGNLLSGFNMSYLSGNTQTSNNQTTDHLFDVLYGARHRFFGMMDYFNSFASNTKQGGLSDYSLYFNYKFSKSVNICNTGHFFQLAQTNQLTPDNKNLGFENDLVLKYKFHNWGALESGYAFIIPTESLKIMQKVTKNQFSQFFYLQLTLTPTLFSNN